MPEIDVVIPTLLTRPSQLRRAIRSALDQTMPPAKVLLVVDHPDKELPDFPDNRVWVMRNIGPRGPSAARNAGARASSADMVAFLDDDDYFLPEKLKQQVAALGMRDGGCIVSSRAWVKTNAGTRLVPDRTPRVDERMVDYLFPAPGLLRSPRHAIMTPTLLVPRWLLIKFPFREDLSQWEDVEWLLRVTDAGIRVRWVNEPLAVVDQTRADGASLSEEMRPESDERWANKYLASRSRRALHNHLLTYAARGFIRRGDYHQAVRLVISACMELKAPPSLLAKTVAAIVLPQSLYNLIRRRRTG